MGKRKVYDALTIARYIINRCNAEGTPISNLKLQKLLYYVQAVFLSINEEICYKDVIEAWAFGPVVPNVYHEFKEYGSNNIPQIIEYFDIDPSSETFFTKVKFNDDIINEEDKKLINETLGIYNRYSATKLVEMTHSESPWKDIYKRDAKHVIISVESMKKFYKNYYIRN